MRRHLLILCLVLIYCWAMPVQAACPYCERLSFPPTVTALTSQLNPQSSYLRTSVSNAGSGYDIVDGIYPGWCGDYESTSLKITASVVTPLSTYSAEALDPAQHGNPAWPKVNYLLNHRLPGALWSDVQRAIWLLLGSPEPTNLGPTSISDQMYNDAMKNGADFAPGPGQVLAVLLFRDGFGVYRQDNFIEVPIPLFGAIGDYVWMDANHNGIQDAGEVGIDGVVVQLKDAGGNVIQTMTTASHEVSPGQTIDGYYLFTGLSKGNYTVYIDLSQPAILGEGLTPTLFTQGSDTAIDSNNPAGAPVNLPEDRSVDVTIDFGFVGPAPLTLHCPANPTGEAGVPFYADWSATGGVSPYTYEVVGTLPAGLELNSTTGVVSGRPTVSGSFSIKITDAKGNVANGCVITIKEGPSLVCTAAGSSGQVGTPFSSPAPTVTGGTQPYTFKIAGTLPGGLTLNTSTGVVSGTPSSAGTFSVAVTDALGVAAVASCPIAIIAPEPGPRVGTGDAATIGFWHNKNGQKVIKDVNGGSTSTALANWLATQFPCLYGAHSTNNMTGKTNADVAALFMKFFGVSGTKADAQILAGALAVYVTDKALSGTGTAITEDRAKFDFNSLPGGTGIKTYNVGKNGTALGLTNNTPYTVLELLYQANLMKQQGTFNSTAFNDVFDGINTTGDIK